MVYILEFIGPFRIKDTHSTAFTIQVETIHRALAFADAYPEIDLSEKINQAIIAIIDEAIDSQAQSNDSPKR